MSYVWIVSNFEGKSTGKMDTLSKFRYTTAKTTYTTLTASYTTA
ncbi:hypothetical protein [Planococcus halotolerans]|nr:hypothetical protein [Planococcus halotolerans]